MQVRNKYQILGDITVIWINRKNNSPLACLIDTVDLPIVMNVDEGWRFGYGGPGKSTSVFCFKKLSNKKYKKLRMGRMILHTPRHLCVHHLSHNTLDNRRSNIVNCTIKQNNQSRLAKFISPESLCG